MALADIYRRVMHDADGVQTRFPFAFTVFAEDQVSVYFASDATGEIVVPAKDYEVELGEDGTGGTVIFNVPPAEGARLAIMSNVPYTQEMELTNYGGFNPQTLNDNSDVQEAQIQQLKEELSRSIQLRPTDKLTGQELLDRIFQAAALVRQYMDEARWLSLSFQIPNGTVVSMYNVRVLKRNPVPWGTNTPDENWLLCDGGPDGATGTVPDLIGKMIRGSMPDDQGETTGHDKIRITYDQMPVHSHPTVASGVSGWHTHDRGSMEITGTFGVDAPNASPAGAFYNAGSQGYGQKDRGGGMLVGFKASENWTGVTSASGEHQHEVIMGPAGKGAEVDIRPVTYTLAFFVKVPRANAGSSDWTRPIPDDPISPYKVGDIIYGDYYDPMEKVVYPDYNYIVVDKDMETTFESGDTGKVSLLMAEHLLPWENMQYGPQAFYACPNGLPAGTYYVNDYDANSGYFSFTLGLNVPAGGSLYLDDMGKTDSERRVRSYAPDGISILERVPIRWRTREGTLLDGENKNSAPWGSAGCAIWSVSAVRQWLNSDAPAGGWWRKLNKFCVAPDNLFERAGYLAGLPKNIVRSLRAVRVETATGTGNTDSEVTYDRVWLPQAEEFGFFCKGIYYGTRAFPEHQLAYWKEKVGEYKTVDNGTLIEELIAHPVDKNLAPDQTTPLDYWTRTIGGYAGLVYGANNALTQNVAAGGTVYKNSNTKGGRAVRPVLAISQGA